MIVRFAYDALGRRLYKNSRSKYRDRPQAGPVWNKNARRQQDEELGCGFTWYTWDGDTLATECRDQEERGGSTTHYVFEPGTFIPVAQAVTNTILDLLPQPIYGDHYSIDRDPVWLHKPKLEPIDAFAWYQCDHLGTPLELTDAAGEVSWSGAFKAWGQLQTKSNSEAQQASINNPLRFQGQYHDIETGLHYNRHRYYDPCTTRFIGKDPIGFAGSINLYHYTPNPVTWIDPLGLKKCPCDPCDVASHGDQPSPRPGGKQSHHIIQNAWATENVPGYAKGGKQTAPSILLTASPQHAIVTTRQNARRDERLLAGEARWGTSLADEFNNAYRDLGAAGISERCKRKAMKQAYRYFYGE